MGMGSLRGERSGLTEAMEGDGKGGEIACQVLCYAKCAKSTACTTEFTESTESEEDEEDSPAKPLPYKRSWGLKPQGSADSALRYSVRAGSLGARLGRAKARPYVQLAHQCAPGP